MRIKNLLIGVALVGIIVTGFLGCNSDSASRSIRSSQSTAQVFDPNGGLAATTGMTAADAGTRASITAISNRVSVTRLMESYALAGFEFDISNSFVEEGSIAIRDSLDIHWVRRTVLSMRYVPDTSRMAVYLIYAESEFPAFILPMTVAFGQAPDTGQFMEAGQHLWIMGRDLVPDLEIVHGVLPSATGTTSWLGCWLGGSAGGCLTAAIGCTVSGPGWAGCAGAWCAGSVLGSAIGCAISSWL